MAGDITPAELVTYGVCCDAHTPMADRLVIIYRELTALIKSHQPASAAVENFSAECEHGHTVGQARVVALLALA
jgi:Holliday junction resolvasome RuvABC endonuclease subunit